MVPLMLDGLAATLPEPKSLDARPLATPAIVTACQDARSDGVEGAFFHEGSTRDAVIDAQGSVPTYASKDGRTLWSGSAKVMFDRDGRVERLAQGVPGLNVRRSSYR
jgi:hypothetical protein